MAKPKPTEIIEEDSTTGLARIIVHYLVDSWILMVILGTLGHKLPFHYFYRFSYFLTVLVVIGADCLYSAKSKLIMRAPDKRGN